MKDWNYMSRVKPSCSGETLCHVHGPLGNKRHHSIFKWMGFKRLQICQTLSSCLLLAGEFDPEIDWLEDRYLIGKEWLRALRFYYTKAHKHDATSPGTC